MTWKGFIRGWTIFTVVWLVFWIAVISIFSPQEGNLAAQEQGVFIIGIPMISLVLGVVLVGISKESARNERPQKTDNDNRQG
jgi:hypothetical protein